MIELAVDFYRQVINKTAVKRAAVYILLLSMLSLLAYIIAPISIKHTIIKILSALYATHVFIALIACVWAARNSKSYERLWYLSAFGMTFWYLGSLTIAIYTITRGPNNIPSPSLADITTIGYVPAILAVMFSIGKIRPPFDNRKKQFLANVTMASLSALLLCHEFILIPVWNSEPNASLVQKLFTIAYPMFDWIVLTSLLFASHRLLESQTEGWILLLGTAFGSSVLADIPIYITGQGVNPATLLLLIIMALLVTLSAVDEVKKSIIGIITSSRAASSDIADRQSASQKPLYTLVTPLLVTAVIPIVWFTSSHRDGESVMRIVFSSAIVLLLIFRNYLLVSDNALLFSKTLRDGLTGLNNHRYFQEALKIATSKADRTKKSVSLIILDIDDFSQINNAYGHLFGDRVLATIGREIASVIRETDEACRLSGDDFGIILPKTTETKTLAIAEEIKNHISKKLKNTFSDKEITITMGISTYPDLAKTKDELLHTADGALYWGKLHGKNSILVYDPDVVEALSAEERAKMVEEAALVDMVRSLASAVDARDPYTRLHSKGVSEMASKLAEQLGLDTTTVSRIEIAGILHDVGKIGIPDQILNKPGRLTDEEMDVIKAHPTLSAQIINSTSLKDIVPAVSAHHERWDGNGYPTGLKGEEIPFEARILAIADTFDAMTTDRPYRKGLSIKDALCEIKRCAGTQFDPQLIDAFLAIFPDISIEPEESQTAQSDTKLNKAAGL